MLMNYFDTASLSFKYNVSMMHLYQISPSCVLIRASTLFSGSEMKIWLFWHQGFSHNYMSLSHQWQVFFQEASCHEHPLEGSLYLFPSRMQFTIVFSLSQTALGTVFSASGSHDLSHGRSKDIVLGKVPCSYCIGSFQVLGVYFVI